MISGEPVMPGSLVDVDERLASTLIGSKKAVKASEDAPAAEKEKAAPKKTSTRARTKQ